MLASGRVSQNLGKVLTQLKVVVKNVTSNQIVGLLSGSPPMMVTPLCLYLLNSGCSVYHCSMAS
jgi:hypothetical protein